MESDRIVGPVTVGSVAHGGHCVARIEDPEAGPGGRVVFVRHALPGERVRIRLTDTSQARFWRGDAVEILAPSADRRTPPCPVFHPGGCGGCDFQHATEAAQRTLKTQVVREQLGRLGGFDWAGVVEEVLPVWGWRTRMRYHLTPQGLGLRAHRSHEVIPLPAEGCVIAAPAGPGGGPPPGREAESSSASSDPRTGSKEHRARPRAHEELLVVTTADGVHTGPPGSREVIAEYAAGRSHRLGLSGFWQVHPRAADVLVEAVLDGLAPEAGERAFDLYCGVGLFAGALAGRGVQVWGVESAPGAVKHARHNVPEAKFSIGRVEQTLRTLPQFTDLVVLDPPRAGAGRGVLGQVSARRPRAIAYVACDPAALGRDVGYATELGWRVIGVRAFDLFPQTHHVECVAILAPA